MILKVIVILLISYEIAYRLITTNMKDKDDE
jgi:hypothetical protein